MGESIDYLGDARMFVKLDENCGYQKVGIFEQERDKTTFMCHHELNLFI